MAAISDPWNDVSHKVSVHPIDDACIDISHLKKAGGLGVAGAAIDPDHVRHPPVAAVFNDYGHAHPDMEEHRI